MHHNGAKKGHALVGHIGFQNTGPGGPSVFHESFQNTVDVLASQQAKTGKTS
jgi:hypothetical protein